MSIYRHRMFGSVLAVACALVAVLLVCWENRVPWQLLITPTVLMIPIPVAKLAAGYLLGGVVFLILAYRRPKFTAFRKHSLTPMIVRRLHLRRAPTR